MDDNVPSDKIVSQAVSCAPVLKFTVAYACKVWVVGAEAHFCNDMGVVGNGFDVISHGADDTS